MRVLKTMLVLCSVAILFAACASGPPEPEPTVHKKSTPPPPAQAQASVERPTPVPGTNSGLGAFPTPTGVAASSTAVAPANPEGPKLYAQQGCVQCHGGDGKGIMTGAPNFTDKGWQTGHNDSQLTNTIKNGKPPMPGYGSRLNADQVTTLLSYVRSFAK